MSNLTVELGDKDNVISIEVLRKHRYQREGCFHRNIEVDETLANVLCRDCGKEVNAVAWIAGSQAANAMPVLQEDHAR